MGLFQKSVENQYLNGLDKALIDEKYSQFQAYFANPERQENIRNSKEEQFQEGFLRELFVKVFGYTLNPEPNFNLTTELKNIINSKKADGAILKGEDALAVIELKGTDTTDLDKIETQAFGYKNNHPKCVYVITSNFEKLRFYIQNAVDHIDFDLFNLSREQFSLLWLCLAKENLLNGIPQKIKESSLLKEENVTKELYADYSKFRTAIYNNLVKNNPETDKLLLFSKTQKLLDRFLFVFFAEDRLLLPPNSISEIVKQWTTLKDFDAYVPLYDRFKKYFGYMNTGHKGKKYDVYAYNGGLFVPDEILDNISIDDAILHEHTLKLSSYDFETDVDVNILGHIFEHSLGEIENVQAEIKGEKVETQKSKRKKDGIFYTPKYITKYIVENTIGKLCEDKRIELDIVDEEYAKGRRNRKKDTIKKLDDKLTDYRNWLLSLTILDPACGSGAFLNQALDFLITEHRKIDDLRAQMFGSGIVFSDITTDILEKNIYGVDLNSESIEIAKLSLWLRTAQKGRKLNKLNNNIKCGNSLIHDPEVAGEKAFNWHNEFPEVFVRGGFDIIIGNPPYVSSKGESFSEKIKIFLTKEYSTAVYQIDLYILFIEKVMELYNNTGICSLIIPNAWLNNLFLKDVRKYVLDNSSIIRLITMPPKTFADANVDTIIFTFSKPNGYSETSLLKSKNEEFFELGNIEQNEWLSNENYTININTTKQISKILNKTKKHSIVLSSFTEIARGVGVYHKRVGHTKEIIAQNPYQSNRKEDETFVPYLRGKNVCSWQIKWDNDSFISYGNWLAEPREPKYFEGERIVLRQIPSKRLIATYVEDKFITDQSVFIARFNNDSVINAKAVLPLINSKLFVFYFRYNYSEFDELFPKVKLQHFKDLPIHKDLKSDNNLFFEKANKRLDLSIQYVDLQDKFTKFLQSQMTLSKVSKKIQNSFELDFSDFIKELNNIIKKTDRKKLSKSDEMEWMELFENKKNEAQNLQSEIDTTDSEIDQMVYKLYGLTEQEIKIVEESV